MAQVGQAARKRTILVSGKNDGFSLLELLVVMFLIGLMTTFIIPTLQNLRPAHKQDQFVNNCRTVLAIAWQKALATGKLHRVYFDLAKRIMRAEVQTSEPDAKEETFGTVQRAYDEAEFTWPSVITIKEFFIEGTERLHSAGSQAEAVWFYVVPDGMVQEVVMNIEDMSSTDERGQGVPLGIVINPFTVQLRTYDAFQQP